MITYAKTLKNSKIHVILWYDDGSCTINMNVLAMDEKFRWQRNDMAEGNVYKAKNGVEIRSVNSPALNHNVVYLRGNQTSASNTTSTNCSTYSDAVNKIESFYSALEEWSNNWSGFGVVTINTVKKKVDVRANLKRIKELSKELKILKEETKKNNETIGYIENEIKELKGESKKYIEDI